jgi:hypothetical protein
MYAYFESMSRLPSEVMTKLSDQYQPVWESGGTGSNTYVLRK